MIVAGFGCRGGAEEKSLRAVLAAHGETVSALATLAHKEAMLTPLAHDLGLPLILIDPIAVAGVETPTQSAASLAAYGTGSVAEAVALIAAGPGARLAAHRIISPDGQATCALAQGVSP